MSTDQKWCFGNMDEVPTKYCSACDNIAFDECQREGHNRVEKLKKEIAENVKHQKACEKCGGDQEVAVAVDVIMRIGAKKVNL